ncbi:zinc-ribbon domain-containing protein [Marinomonas sp. C2222]|uniref:Zinc-ribbon domain-containing protein n=1 Tax=Marinomonas sargassi TaxID=2984494 RepID=A0ABT2YUM3_9GAMM|nr:DUF3426 domain-containing protein [Marinomonas sargassi]MCV2403304.1 zinc-ribbon domain-containing protein [Marinomonas sargassi]
MANSLITRCPKCSTAFRVTDDVLAMAKGKVRCGQCFHIFDTAKVANQVPQPTKATPTKAEPATAVKAKENLVTAAPAEEPRKSASLDEDHNKKTPIEQATIESDLTADDEIINPDWLQTLFDDEDLQPPEDPLSPKDSLTPKPINDVKSNTEKNSQKKADERSQDDLAPWELELAEVEAALQKARNTSKSTPKPKASKATEKPAIQKPKAPQAKSQPQGSEPAQEPDYMVALHSLAQTASAQARPSDIKSQHSILEQLSAQESLAPLFEENEPKSHTKKSRTWLWFMGFILGAAILVGQVATHYFDAGSRSPSLRPFYQMACSYLDCALPGFEDITGISIQHVRIQSHPSIPDTLLVNAIMTNTSSFSQPMPKIALEFFDLNGAPVAARLFAPRDYLHKDFLDITYMPSNTPIHLVIPIKDPGATAVTHQLNAFSADTRSY